MRGAAIRTQTVINAINKAVKLASFKYPDKPENALMEIGGIMQVAILLGIDVPDVQEITKRGVVENDGE